MPSSSSASWTEPAIARMRRAVGLTGDAAVSTNASERDGERASQCCDDAVRAIDMTAVQPAATEFACLQSSRTSLGVASPSVVEDARLRADLKRKAPIRAVLHRHVVVLAYSFVCGCCMLVLIYLSFFAARMDDGARPEFLGCRQWAYGTDCGMWGINCRPFESEWSPIRCRARCSLGMKHPGFCIRGFECYGWSGRVLKTNVNTCGVDQASSLTVYGSGTYRADSRICRAAIHAGVIGTNGGCALMRFSGAAHDFQASSAHGITSKAFASWFPKTLTFKAAPSYLCTDLTWVILVFGVLAMIGYAFLPRTQPHVLWTLLVVWGFFYVRLVGQPSSVDYPDMAVTSFSDLFILLALAYWIYHIAPVYTLERWSTLRRRDRALMWGVCYVLPLHILININLFQFLPWLNVDFGGYENPDTNIGTYVAFAVLGIGALYCVVSFLKQLHRQALTKQFVMWYALVGLYVFFSWAIFPSTGFHLHHTMLGALFLPITRFPTLLAAAAQSALLGCFLQGYAAWGWAPYLETTPTYLTIPVPDVPPSISNITRDAANISWTPVGAVDGYSLRLNKVEVYRGTNAWAVITGLEPNMTYFPAVACVAEWGTDGKVGPEANFTTIATQLL